MLRQLAVPGGERDRRVHDGRPRGRAASTSRREFSSIPVLSITPLTASWRTPPSEVKSFWYSIRTTAVRFGSNGMEGLLATRLGGPLYAPDVIARYLRALTFVAPVAAQLVPIALKAILTV
jgi:hypothetical protein